MRSFIRSVFVLSLGTLALASARASQWYVSYGGTNSSQLQISYGTASLAPQYAVLDLPSSYFRMNYGPSSGWGTSVVLMPSYWSGGRLYQGYPVSANVSVSGSNLVLGIKGQSNGMVTTETVVINPPTEGSILASVTAGLTGTVLLDNRPGEAFKPVFLSSMHDSSSAWDSSSAYTDLQVRSFPGGGWIVAPTPLAKTTRFGLLGGTSTWKVNAPSVQIFLSQALQIAGWLSTDSNPNDDNVGYWAASSTVLTSWNYQILVSGATMPTRYFTLPLGSTVPVTSSSP